MCFSAEASFTAAALLGVIGYSTIAETHRKKELMLAAIPFLFAIQQFSEGVLWLCLMNDMSESIVAMIAKWVFLFFAFVNWPFWLPMSLYIIEPKGVRKILLLLCLLLGITFIIWNLSLVVGEPVTVGIVDHSIQYSAYDVKPLILFWLLRLCYLLAILIPCFVSSFSFMWIFGIIVAATFVGAEYFYQVAFISVWCFFAAVTSGALFLLLRHNRKREQVQK